jgi:hypothetical protein
MKRLRHNKTTTGKYYILPLEVEHTYTDDIFFAHYRRHCRGYIDLVVLVTSIAA